MIVPDINLLVFAYNVDAPHHASAKDWWEGLLNGYEEVGLPWSVVTGFIRVMANPNVVSPPLSPLASVEHVRTWLRYPHVTTLDPGIDHLDYLYGNFESGGLDHGLVPDAHIAAVALENDAEVHTRDSDFARFTGLRWRDPLA